MCNVHAKLSERLGRIERDIRYLETAVTGDKLYVHRNSPGVRRMQPAGAECSSADGRASPRVAQINRAPRYDTSRSRWSQDREMHHRHASERVPRTQPNWNIQHRASYTAGGATRRRQFNSIYLRDFRRPERSSASDAPSESNFMAEVPELVPRTEPLQRKAFPTNET